MKILFIFLDDLENYPSVHVTWLHALYIWSGNKTGEASKCSAAAFVSLCKQIVPQVPKVKVHLHWTTHEILCPEGRNGIHLCFSSGFNLSPLSQYPRHNIYAGPYTGTHKANNASVQRILKIDAAAAWLPFITDRVSAPLQNPCVCFSVVLLLLLLRHLVALMCAGSYGKHTVKKNLLN